MEKHKIAIQGVLGSFHHQATEKYFGKDTYTLLEIEKFRTLAESVKQGASDFGVMAIENTIAGSILPNYALINEFGLHIIGEIYMPIHHHLMALKATKIEDLKEVQSHYMALLQCNLFLDSLKEVKIVESIDTALSAKEIAEKGLKNVAAIAPKMAAESYGLKVLDDNIQTIKENYTRFFVLNNKPLNIENFNKASLRFSLKHESGSLAEVLTQIAKLNINLTKIQSLPVIERPWKYAFHLDVTFEESLSFLTLVDYLEKNSSDFRILGKYKNGRK